MDPEEISCMRIAQIAPLYESVPPRLYGGTERVVSYLTEELVRQGHDVTLFCSGDSSSAAEMIPICEKALRFEERCVDPGFFHLMMVEEVLRNQDRFDIIHSHIDYIGFVLSRRTHLPVLSTLHGRLDMWEHSFIFREFSESPLVSISNSQRTPVKFSKWLGTVYHGIPRDLYSFNENGGDYLVYVGRISPEKRVDSAISLAVRSGLPLKIAAKVDKVDLAYFEQEIKPLLDNPLIEFLGEVGDEEKNRLVGSALAFLHPIDWPEPFGLALIEAMACGTPVIARKRGAIPEVVDHGVTGFIFEEDDEAIGYIKNQLPSFSRQACRNHFEKRFLAERMAGDYLSVYRSLLDQKAERRIA
jgi:glycosyltransferase involved in cell wall biosynthesis